MLKVNCEVIFLTVKIGNYNFEGPFESTDPVKDKSGLFAVLYKKEDKHYLIDIEESSKIKEKLDNHNRSKCWKKQSDGEIEYSVLYTPKLKEKDRKEIESKIRARYIPPCGKK